MGQIKDNTLIFSVYKIINNTLYDTFFSEVYNEENYLRKFDKKGGHVTLSTPDGPIKVTSISAIKFCVFAKAARTEDENKNNPEQ